MLKVNFPYLNSRDTPKELQKPKSMKTLTCIMEHLINDQTTLQELKLREIPLTVFEGICNSYTETYRTYLKID